MEVGGVVAVAEFVVGSEGNGVSAGLRVENIARLKKLRCVFI